MPKKLLPVALICLLLSACSSDKRIVKITVEPSAVINAEVFVREPSASYENVSLGGAAFRSAEFAHTLNQKKAVDTERLSTACRSSGAPEVCKKLGKKSRKTADNTGKHPSQKVLRAKGAASNIYSDSFGTELDE